MPGRIRRSGAGRKSIVERDPKLLVSLERLMEPETRGDPESPLRWICRSTRTLSAQLTRQKHSVSHEKVAQLLRDQNYSLQSNRKTEEGADHPDRDAQFEHINAQALKFQAAGRPVISVDTKKKELVGNYKNPGSDYRPRGHPDQVNVHDFPDEELGKAIPYGVYDIGANVGWVSVGIDHDTGEFAVNSIRRWWETMGCERYLGTDGVMVTADGGGSNASKARLWKVELQKLADETGLNITVCHYPPGTSKWNKIEHRMFCQITQNWRGKPLTSRLAVVELIAATTTKTGLTVRCELDPNSYPKGIKISDAEMDAIEIERNAFHPEWNYTIKPRRREAPS